jgi:predicted Na+-dependent transporter
MLSVGIGMEINIKRNEIVQLLKCLGVRYVMALPLALLSWFVLPFDEYVRLALVLLAFSPATLFGALYTAALGGNYPLANTVISVSIIISTAIMTVLVMVLI